VSTKHAPKPPEPSRGSIDKVPDTDQVILAWSQWNRFGGSVRTSGREAMALLALLARDRFIHTLSVYSISPQTDRAQDLLFEANPTALRAHRGEGGAS